MLKNISFVESNETKNLEDNKSSILVVIPSVQFWYASKKQTFERKIDFKNKKLWVIYSFGNCVMFTGTLVFLFNNKIKVICVSMLCLHLFNSESLSINLI